MKKLLLTLGILNAFWFAQASYACGNAFHLYLDPEEYGVVGGTLIRLAGLAPPEPVFKLKHQAVAKVVLGENQELVIDYKRPWFSSDVKLSLVSSKGIKLEEEAIELEDVDGKVTVKYSLHDKGYNTIKMKMSGTHKGKKVERSSVVYIQAKKEPAPQVVQASAPKEL